MMPTPLIGEPVRDYVDCVEGDGGLYATSLKDEGKRWGLRPGEDKEVVVGAGSVTITGTETKMVSGMGGVTKTTGMVTAPSPRGGSGTGRVSVGLMGWVAMGLMLGIVV